MLRRWWFYNDQISYRIFSYTRGMMCGVWCARIVVSCYWTEREMGIVKYILWFHDSVKFDSSAERVCERVPGRGSEMHNNTENVIHSSLRLLLLLVLLLPIVTLRGCQQLFTLSRKWRKQMCFWAINFSIPKYWMYGGALRMNNCSQMKNS